VLHIDSLQEHWHWPVLIQSNDPKSEGVDDGRHSASPAAQPTTNKHITAKLSVVAGVQQPAMK
jgi:hypothetical protein